MNGKIITFYSYKGGTGRSLALANVAWIMAANGLKVLAIDWDLEAPGLHRYFRPFLTDPDLTSSPGLMDFLVSYSLDFANGRKVPRSLLENATSVQWEFPKKGSLDFVPVGRQDSSYPLRVDGFNWDNFYGPLGGRDFLETVKEELRSEYDYILIDSRTGMCDTSGICTVQMPDTLVVCFTMNAQSMQGSSSVAFSVKNQRSVNPVKILPVPMRVDFAEKDILDRTREAVRKTFAPVLTGHTRTNEYWGMVESPYEPFYAFSEVLAPFGDRPFSTRTLLAAATNLTKILTDGQVTKMEPLSEEVRQAVLQKFQ